MANSLRLLCLMFTLLLALPAVQARACSPEIAHGAAAAASMTHHGLGAQHRIPAHGPAQARHDCMGCVAPIDVRAYRPVERLTFHFERARPVVAAAFDAGRNAPPEPPPPRTAV